MSHSWPGQEELAAARRGTDLQSPVSAGPGEGTRAWQGTVRVCVETTWGSLLGSYRHQPSELRSPGLAALQVRVKLQPLRQKPDALCAPEIPLP